MTKHVSVPKDGLSLTAMVISPTMWFKTKAPVLGDFEQLVLLGVLRLEDAAYGAAIRQEIHARSGRDVSINAVYTTLDRLETAAVASSMRCGPRVSRRCARRTVPLPPWRTASRAGWR